MTGWIVAGGMLGGLVCLSLCGCDRDVVPISGRVTLSGKPLSGAVVTFQPIADQNPRQPSATGSVGRTDSEGRFTLRLVEPDMPGAAVGMHSVTISPVIEAPNAAPAKDPQLPKAWRDGSKRFTVPPGGTHEANFEIVADDQSPRPVRGSAKSPP